MAGRESRPATQDVDRGKGGFAQKHWHGASPHGRMTDIAVSEHLDGKSVEWMEKVSDAQYNSPVTERAAAPAPAARPGVGADGQPTTAQRLFGDISPKMVELTDGVLFGDIWERPELSKRDRSLVTVSALIAMNLPDQIRSHFVRPRENGVTKEELHETITHLAFYAGWPNAVTRSAWRRKSSKENNAARVRRGTSPA